MHVDMYVSYMAYRVLISFEYILQAYKQAHEAIIEAGHCLLLLRVLHFFISETLCPPIFRTTLPHKD
jgi:hypothetical protein